MLNLNRFFNFNILLFIDFENPLPNMIQPQDCFILYLWPKEKLDISMDIFMMWL